MLLSFVTVLNRSPPELGGLAIQHVQIRQSLHTSWCADWWVVLCLQLFVQFSAFCLTHRPLLRCLECVQWVPHVRLNVELLESHPHWGLVFQCLCKLISSLSSLHKRTQTHPQLKSKTKTKQNKTKTASLHRNASRHILPTMNGWATWWVFHSVYCCVPRWKSSQRVSSHSSLSRLLAPSARCWPRCWWQSLLHRQPARGERQQRKGRHKKKIRKIRKGKHTCELKLSFSSTCKSKTHTHTHSHKI